MVGIGVCSLIAIAAFCLSRTIAGLTYISYIIILQGLCLKYKVKPVKLRQVNRFSGSTLACAPQILYIPVSKKAYEGGAVKVQDRNSDDFKLYSLIANFPSLRFQEARAYLGMNDW